MGEPRWLLLAHQLPARLSNARVKTWRRLQRLGAVPIRNAVYALPNTEACREDFEWIRSEIVALGGDATVFAADAISHGGAEDIVAAFQRTRNQEYQALKAEVDRVLGSIRGKRAPALARNQRLRRTVRALKDRFGALERIDFHNATARDAAATALAALDRAVDRERPAAPRTAKPSPPDLRRRRWVTRPRPGVDRMASAWLIRRFIDASATFAFADTPAESDVPFDMYTGEFSHQGGRCTFEVLAERFDLASPAVSRIGQIVHDLDMKEAKYAPLEAPAIGRMVEGLRSLHADDGTLLEQGIVMFEALARSFESTDVPTQLRREKTDKRAGGRRAHVQSQ